MRIIMYTLNLDSSQAGVALVMFLTLYKPYVWTTYEDTSPDLNTSTINESLINSVPNTVVFVEKNHPDVVKIYIYGFDLNAETSHFNH